LRKLENIILLYSIKGNKGKWNKGTYCVEFAVSNLYLLKKQGCLLLLKLKKYIVIKVLVYVKCKSNLERRLV
jgi:hypothetical protein